MGNREDGQMNKEQYPDPTAEMAVRNVTREGRRKARQTGNRWRYSVRRVRVWRRAEEKNLRKMKMVIECDTRSVVWCSISEKGQLT